MYFRPLMLIVCICHSRIDFISVLLQYWSHGA